MHDHHHAPTLDPVASTLLAQRQRFLSFLVGRVESPAVAEEILQDAFAKSVEKGHQLKDDESAVAWFYRLLRNAVVDHYRRRGAEARALEHEAQLDVVLEPEARRTICACINDVLPLLKEEQRSLLQAVDIDDKAVVDVARDLGVPAGTARVRLHRARQALKQQLERVCTVCATHGCLDCSCSTTERSSRG